MKERGLKTWTEAAIIAVKWISSLTTKSEHSNSPGGGELDNSE